MAALLARLIKDRSGATMIEYGLLAALVSVAAITMLSNIGLSIFDIVRDALLATAAIATRP